MLETNWAGNLSYSANHIHYPETLEDLRRLVSTVRNVKALGSRHSFSTISNTTGDLVSLIRMSRFFALDRDRMTVTVDGGSRYGDICSRLNSEGFALANLASLPHISVSGACATGTHGSGDGNRCLSASVSSMEFMTADGSLVQVGRETDHFEGMVVHLGALGIITKLTLDVIPAFRVRQTVYEGLRLEHAAEWFDELMSAAYSVSIFTDWKPNSQCRVWVKSRSGGSSVTSGPETPDPDAGEISRLRRLGTTPGVQALHPIASMSAACCTEQLGVVGDWHERLPHFRMEQTPSAGEELQSEYMLAREDAGAAFHVLREMAQELAPVLMISEVRTVAADRLWMSPCYGRDTVAFHFTWVRDQPAVERLLHKLEAALAPFETRPHWGKLFAMGARELEALYPKMGDFRHLLRQFDPDGKFRNEFLDRSVLS